MPLVFGGPGMALPKTLAKSETRRIKAEYRVAFSLNTFFWPRKRKYFGCRAETRLQNNRRDSDTLNQQAWKLGKLTHQASNLIFPFAY